MCGIFGYIGSPDRARVIDLGAAQRALRHRGPDDQGTYYHEDLSRGIACAMAHTRLAIIDLSLAGHQPMSTEDGRFTVDYNGEIYNFREIRSELHRLGYRFRSDCDTEVVLQAFAAWGPKCLERFRGIFAFAIWDSGDARLFMARDRLGVKPLYYTTTPDGGLAFASEIRPLIATGIAARRLSHAALSNYLSFGSVSDPDTILENVRSLPPAHEASFTSSGLTIRRYWSVPAEAAADSDFDTAVAQIEPLLRQSVQSELVSDVPLGVFLSGGIDSSVVTALASAACEQPIHTFTVTFDEEAYNEEKFAAAVASRYGTDHHQVHLRGPSAAAAIDQVIDALDQPSADGVNTYFVAEAARKSGLAVVLSGVGGDELFAGYPAFRYFRALLRVGRTARILPPAMYRPWASGFNGLSNRAAKVLALLETRGIPEKAYGVVRTMFTRRQVEQLLAPLGTGVEWSILPEAVNHDDDPVNLYSRFELSNYVPNTLLRDTDSMSMAHSLEVRVPLLDHHLVEKMLMVPGHLKVRKPNKALMAQTIADLPEEVRTRPKAGFVLPLDAWFRGPLKERISDLLTGSASAVPFLDRQAVAQMWRAFLRGSEYISYSRVWCVAALVAWCERNRIT